MTGNPLLDLVALPVAFGLFGFIEPCSIGATLIFIKVLEGKSAAEKVVQVATFALGRGIFIGLLGAVAVLVGSAFFGFQKAARVVPGALYTALGLAYLSGKTGWVARSFGPSLGRFSSARGSAALGVIFGLNIPACAAPLLVALLGASAAGGSRGGSAAEGFVSLQAGSAVAPPARMDGSPADRARRLVDLVRSIRKDCLTLEGTPRCRLITIHNRAMGHADE